VPFPIFEKQADIPKGFEELYEEKAGKWQPKEAEDDAAEGLRAELAEAETKRKAAERLTNKANAELQKLQTRQKAADAGMTEEKLKELREEAKAEALAEVKDDLAERDRLKMQNRGLLLDADMKARALKAGIAATKIDDFWALRAGQFDLTDDGKPMVKGKPGLDPDKHLASLLKLNPEWVVGTKANGGGANGGAGKQGANTGKVSFEDMLKNPTAALQVANAETA
jgi:hypothetical protein